MKLTRASTYAIYAVKYMAGLDNQLPVASHNIAKEQGIPERFLVKVLRPLVSGRMLVSLPGPNGGYRLAKPASKISVLDIVEAVDGPIRGHIPFIMGKEKDTCDDRLESLCNDVADQSRKKIQKVHISDLVNGH